MSYANPRWATHVLFSVVVAYPFLLGVDRPISMIHVLSPLFAVRSMRIPHVLLLFPIHPRGVYMRLPLAP